MVDFLSHFGESSSPEPVQHFGLVRINDSGTFIRLLAAEPERIAVHWIAGGNPRIGWSACPGAQCPVCRVGERPQQWILLLVVNFEMREAQVMAVPDTSAVGSLRNGLKPHLQGDPSDRLLAITRDESRRHKVTARSLPPPPDDYEDVATEALEMVRAGARLSSAIRAYLADELADIPEIARRLRLREDDPSEESDDGDA